MSQISSDESGLGKWFNVFTSMVNSLYFHLTLGKKKSAWRISSLFLTCRGPKLRSPSFCYHWSSTPMVWTGRQTAVQKDFCPCWAYTKFYFHLADWDRDTTKFCRTLLCTCRLHVYNPVCRRRGSLWRYGLCSSEQAHCGFFPFPFKLWGVWNPARHADKEGLYGTQITWVDQTHVCCCSHAPTWALSCLPSAPWSWN